VVLGEEVARDRSGVAFSGGAGSDVAALAARTIRRCDQYVLSGSTIFITNGVAKRLRL